jgi:hypothetical protein
MAKSNLKAINNMSGGGILIEVESNELRWLNYESF